MNGNHALCCIIESAEELISGQPGLTVSVNRDDCWDNEELHQHGQCAANLIVSSAIATGNSKNRKISTGDVLCTYNNVLTLDIEIYAIKCEGSLCKAASASGFVTSKFLSDDHGLPVTRVNYRGESYRTTTKGDIEFSHIVLQLELEYVFAPSRPWLTFKGI